MRGVCVLDGKVDVGRRNAGSLVVHAVLGGQVLVTLAEHDRRVVADLFRQGDVTGVGERSDDLVSLAFQVADLRVGDGAGVSRRSASADERGDKCHERKRSAKRKGHGEKGFLRGVASKEIFALYIYNILTI